MVSMIAAIATIAEKVNKEHCSRRSSNSRWRLWIVDSCFKLVLFFFFFSTYRCRRRERQRPIDFGLERPYCRKRSVFWYSCCRYDRWRVVSIWSLRSLRSLILVPRAHDPSGPRQGSRALAGSKPGVSEPRTSGPSTQTQKFETIVVANGYKNAPSLRLRIFRNWPELSIPEGSWALGTRMYDLWDRTEVYLNDRCRCDRCDRWRVVSIWSLRSLNFFSAIAAIVAIISYDRYDRYETSLQQRLSPVAEKLAHPDVMFSRESSRGISLVFI